MKTFNLNDVSKFILGLVVVVAVMGIAGTADMVEQVNYTMPEEIYQDIKSKLSKDGKVPSEYQIATYYLDHYGRI